MNFKKSSKVVITASMVLTVVALMGATVIGAYVEPVREAAIKNGIIDKILDTQVQTENKKTQRQSEVDEKSPESKAEWYYNNNKIMQFGAVFSKLDTATQKTWMDRFYFDNDTSFFSIAVNHLSSDSTLIETYIKRAYEDDAISFFAILLDCLNSGSALIKTYAKKAYIDNKIDFFAVLTDVMDAELLKSWQDKATKGNMDIGFASVLLDTDEFLPWIEKAEAEDAEQYIEWGIMRDNTDFYYLNQLVRVFFDQYEGAEVIRELSWNPKGIVDVKVMRNMRNQIVRVEYMTVEEVTELFGTDVPLDFDTEKNDFAAEDVYRLTAEELPEDVVNQMMDDGQIKTWYIYHSKERQYLCCKGFAWSYGYQLMYDESGWQVYIQRFQKKDSGDVLLSLPDNGLVTVYCDGQEVHVIEVEK